jgi:hypothetical protein
MTTSSAKYVVANYYHELTTNGYLFKYPDATIGADLTLVWNHLYRHLKEKNIELLTPDEVKDWAEIDGIFFLDYPHSGHPYYPLLSLKNRKFLIVLESPIINTDNHNPMHLKEFDLVLTWNNTLIDFHKILKFQPFYYDIGTKYDIQQSLDHFETKKLSCMIAGAKRSIKPGELYSQRAAVIDYFNKSAPEEFDLFGFGWDQGMLPKIYRGTCSKKLDVLHSYRFNFSYENAETDSGYVSEKVFDALRSLCVPIYRGYSKLSELIPNSLFIDSRDFKNLAEIHSYISSYKAINYRSFLENLLNFWKSEKAATHSIEKAVDSLSSICAKYSRTQISHIFNEPESFRHVSVGPKSYGQSAQNGYKPALVTLEDQLKINNLPTQMPRENFTRLQRFKPLVVFVLIGDELPIFIAAHKIWELYSQFFPEIEIIYCRCSEELKAGYFCLNNNVLTVGIAGDPYVQHINNKVSYASTGIWGERENYLQVIRQMGTLQWALENLEGPFYVYYSSVTSFPDFRGLRSLLDSLPNEKCFAGMPARLTDLTEPELFRGSLILCGTNTVMSHDVCKLLVDRFMKDDKQFAVFPQDVYASYLLSDIPRFTFPFFSFDCNDSLTAHEIRSLFVKQSEMGHVHYRFKSKVPDRVSIDANAMLNVLTVITSNLKIETNFRSMANLVCKSFSADYPADKLPCTIPRSEFFKDRGFLLTSSEYMSWKDTQC